MTLQINQLRKPDESELRKFALLSGTIILVLFGILFPWIFEIKPSLWPWIIALCFILWGIILPMSLERIYLLWMKMGITFSKVTTPVFLGLLFYLVLCPVGIMIRLTRYALLERKYNNAESYRIISEHNQKENMERPF